MNLIEQIRAEMDDDDPADYDAQSQHLREAYESANPEEKDKLDSAFIALCGWSLGYLIALVDA